MPTGMQLNQGYEYRERLDNNAEGLTLLAYLSRRHRHSSAAEWATRITAGQVLIDARAVHPDSILRRGTTLVWRRPPWVEPDAPRSFIVLYEDQDLLAVAKPAGLPTLPGANFLQATLLHQVQTYAPDAAPLHRLGRWTSGIVLCARNQQARAAVVRQWSTQQVVKRYRALALGCPGWDDLSVSTPIGPVPHALLGTLHAAAADGKPALSRITVIERRGAAFLCDVRIATGRPHQIRIHLAAAVHPLLDDPLYRVGGVPAADSHALPGDPGYHLHAAELSIRHPRSGDELLITCEPPPLLRRENAG
jgi:23S rRNA pseudouridine1911/1915/1917 synthase